MVHRKNKIKEKEINENVTKFKNNCNIVINETILIIKTFGLSFLDKKTQELL